MKLQRFWWIVVIVVIIIGLIWVFYPRQGEGIYLLHKTLKMKPDTYYCFDLKIDEEMKVTIAIGKSGASWDEARNPKATSPHYVSFLIKLSPETPRECLAPIEYMMKGGKQVGGSDGWVITVEDLELEAGEYKLLVAQTNGYSGIVPTTIAIKQISQ